MMTIHGIPDGGQGRPAQLLEVDTRIGWRRDGYASPIWINAEGRLYYPTKAELLAWPEAPTKKSS